MNTNLIYMNNLIVTFIILIFCGQSLTAQHSSSTEANATLTKIDSLFARNEFSDVLQISVPILNNSRSNFQDSVLIDISLLSAKAAYKLGKYKDAIAYGKLGEALIESTDVEKLTDFWQLISPAYIHLKDKSNALNYLHKTLEVKDQLLALNPIKLVTTYKDLGSLYSYFSDDDLSFENYRKAIELYDDLKLNNPRVCGDLYLNLSANFIVSNDHDSAFHYLNLAKSDYLKVYDATHKKLGSVNYNMSVVQNRRGFVFDAIDLLKETEVSWKSGYGENHPRMAYIQINRGQMALKVGDYEKALNSGFRALDVLGKNDASDPALIRSAHSTIGDAYIKLEDYDKGLYHHEQAFDLTLATYGEKSEFTYSSAANIAILYHTQSKYIDAKPYIEIILKTVDKGSNVHYLTALHLLSKSAFGDKKPNDGFRFLDDAIAITNTEGKDFTEQKILLLLDKAKKKLDFNAISEAHLVIKELKKILYFNEKTISELHFAKQHYIEFEHLKGQYQLQKYFETNDEDLLLASHESFSNAINFYKELMLNTGDQKTQFSLGKNANDLLAHATEAIFLLYQKNKTDYIEDALNIIESSKNLALKKRLIENNMIDSGTLLPELRAKEILLNTTIAELKNEIYALNIDSEAGQLENLVKIRGELHEKQEEKEKLIEQYKTLYPKYYDLKFDNSEISLADIVANIEPNESILNFAVLDSQLYALIITNEKNDFIKIDLIPDFSEIVNDFHASISTHNNTQYQNLLSTISKVLAPISSSLQELNTEKLLIIPDGYLAYIPFEILNYEGDKTLDDYCEIHYSWTSKDIDNSTRNNRHSSKVLAIAPTYFGDNKSNIPESKSLFAELVRSGNVPLPGAEAEVERIKDIFPTTLLKGTEANEVKFKKESQGYGILHLSMHGILDHTNPLLSSLVFTPEVDTIENGLLEAWEIYNLDLNADLVVLSSCNTGYGKLEKSEGVMSLSRAFAHAGVPSAIMTLWQVPDQSTSEIMVNFYQNLKEGQNKSAALRNAKKSYLENTVVPQKKHPFYWAGLVLTGNDDPITISSDGYEWMFGMLSFALLLLLYFMVRKYRK